MKAGQMFSYHFEQNSDSDFDQVLSEGLNSPGATSDNDHEEHKMQSLFSNQMLSIKVTSGGKDVKVVQRNSNNPKQKATVDNRNLSTIKENVQMNG